MTLQQILSLGNGFAEKHISLISDLIFLLGSLPFVLSLLLHNFLMRSCWFIPPTFPASLPLRPAELLRALRLLSVYGASWYVANFLSQESLHFFYQVESVSFFPYFLVNN